uniref:Cilia- and flagella-associated protein 206 n=1 Tax=Albugo laibachii Nc14 TaxID=890382 RepID=F0WFN2_9STRA|nr:conserved hypothetical protein [Albugo laibachii Nc14]|eukprot:CCA20014.1 conserved hypothetical protein [Albugo laibachii Nc14]
MELAKQLVRDVVAQCKHRRVRVTETLAAFIVQMFLHQESDRGIVLQRSMSLEEQTEILERCVRLLVDQKRHPGIETIKMQLDFDLKYATLNEELQARTEARTKRIEALQRTIVMLIPTKSNEFEVMTTIYRTIFSMLMVDAGSEEDTMQLDTVQTREIEKEVVAAMESVFPRMGLKAFVELSVEEKQTQLDDLMDIVAGIRLYNKKIGKGGVGIDLIVSQVEQNWKELHSQLSQETQEMTSLCCDYTEILLHYHGVPADSVEAQPGTELIERWQEELSNRRQLLSYLQTLEEDVSFSINRLYELIERYQQNLQSLEADVGSRTSVPKKQIYPLFEKVSIAWKELVSEHREIQIKSRCFKTLLVCKDAIDLSLNDSSKYVQMYRKNANQTSQTELSDQAKHIPDETSEMQPENDPAELVMEQTNRFDQNSVPIRIPADTSPEFLQLPLEYQGFCPWTVVQRGGLLLPGDPSLGVIQYQNAYHVFVNEQAVNEFLADPNHYIRGILDVAVRQPALIYLLRLHDAFPNISLSSLLQLCSESTRENTSKHEQSFSFLSAPNSCQKVDASTGTPVHFIEKHWDSQYDWNEWSLRRKALQIANLRKCKTVSSQTGLSQFRQEASTQVYLPRIAGTQTRRNKETNPPRVVTFFSGNGSSSSRREQVKEIRPTIISYTFEI